MEITLENRKCHIFQFGSKASPVVFWGISSKNDETTAVCEYIEAAGISCTIFAFETDDWNRDFSPWEMTLGDAYFQGRGYETLSWLKTTLFPGSLHCGRFMKQDCFSALYAAQALCGLRGGRIMPRAKTHQKAALYI